MKIVKILGGLGNQMFQYALAVSLAKRFPSEQVKIDTSCFRGYHLHNGFELDRIFDIQVRLANFWDVLRVAYPYGHYRLWQIAKRVLPIRRTMVVESANGAFCDEALGKDGDAYYDGYWQDERYFAGVRDELLESFTPKEMDARNRELATELSGCSSVSLHVRRGDYNNHPLFRGICDENYYADAIRKIQSLTEIDVYCVFSNDIVWCKEHLPSIANGKPMKYVDWNTGADSYKDMYLMSACRHNIIANSSFSWWGAWLNRHDDKIVVCPQKWNNIKNSQFETPPEWLKIG